MDIFWRMNYSNQRRWGTPARMRDRSNDFIMSGDDNWSPCERLDYEGPYSRFCLQKARVTLIRCLQEGGGILERVKPKIGITNRNGQRAIAPPAPNWSDLSSVTCCDEKATLGYGHSSHVWVSRPDARGWDHASQRDHLLANRPHVTQQDHFSSNRQLAPLRDNYSSPNRQPASHMNQFSSPNRGHTSPIDQYSSSNRAHTSPIDQYSSSNRGHTSPIDQYSSSNREQVSHVDQYSSPNREHTSAIDQYSSSNKEKVSHTVYFSSNRETTSIHNNQNIEQYVTSTPGKSSDPDKSSLVENTRQTSCSPFEELMDQKKRSSPVDDLNMPTFFSGVSQRSSPDITRQGEPRRRNGPPSATVSKAKREEGSEKPPESRTLSPIDKLILNPKAMNISIPDNLKSVIKNLTGELSSVSKPESTQHPDNNQNANFITKKRPLDGDEEDVYTGRMNSDNYNKRFKISVLANVRNDNDIILEKQSQDGIHRNINASHSSKSMMPSRISVYRGPMLQEGDDIVVQPDTTDVFRNTFLLYKCDFCMTTAKSFAEINDHLISTQHFSASLYNARNIASGIELVSISKMLAVKNTFCKSSRLVVACPECKDMFEDIFMCALHAKYTHGGINGFYSVCPIVDHQTVKVSTSPICLAEECNTPFPSHKALHKHWAGVRDHHPVSSLSRQAQHTFTIVICPYCHLTFRDNFIAAKMHAIQMHQKEERSTTALQVKEVLQPRRREELPPLDTSQKGDRGCLLTELEILQNMKHHFDGVSGSKAKVQGIRHRINFLKNMLSMMGDGY